MTGHSVSGDQYIRIDGQLHEIKRQIRQRGGYPFHPDRLQQHLQLAIQGQFPVSRPILPWMVCEVSWFNMKVLLGKLSKVREVHPLALEMIWKEPFSELIPPSREENVETICLTPADLGFLHEPQAEEIFDRERMARWSAQHLNGLAIELNSPEFGLVLGAFYDEQPFGEKLSVAMVPIFCQGLPWVFQLEHNEFGLVVGLTNAGSSRPWPLDMKIVFRLVPVPHPTAGEKK